MDLKGTPSEIWDTIGRLVADGGNLIHGTAETRESRIGVGKFYLRVGRNLLVQLVLRGIDPKKIKYKLEISRRQNSGPSRTFDFIFRDSH